jgi:glycosyltransferase involved in cell wall biosynthesis
VNRQSPNPSVSAARAAPLDRAPEDVGARTTGGRRAVAYIVSRFPKLTETFVLYEMVAVENDGVRVDFYPLMRIRGTKMHSEAASWLERAHFVPFLSGSILGANLHYLMRHPSRYWTTLLTLLRRTWGSARYFLGGLVLFPKAVYFARRMTATRIEHVHAHFANHPAAVAWVIHRLTGIPYSFTAHGSDLHLERRMLEEKAAAAAFVVTISEYNRQLILEECGPSTTAKVVVIHCGVDTAVIRPRPAPAPSAGEQRPFRIVCVGTLHEVKGQTYLLEACRRLSERGLQFTCHLVGDGPDRPRLSKQARQGGIGDRVHFRGWLTREEVRQVLDDADAVAAPSVLARSGSREGIPVALMEAMASGVPVVASRLSGIPELVVNDETGLLVEPRDVEGLAVALERLHGDAGLRRRLGKAGREKVEREFDLQRNASMLVKRFLEPRPVLRPPHQLSQ